MNREQKAATIDALAGELEGAGAVFAVDYRGLTVADAAELRTKLRESEATFRVVKNSLTERAADQAGVEGLKELLQGPTALTLVHGDPALAAKALAEKARAIQLLPFKGGVMGADTLGPDQLVALSRLPAREVLYGQLVGVVASPVGGLVRTLNALISGLAVALGQVQEKRAKEEPAESPAPAAESTPEPSPEPEAAEAPTETAAAEEANAEAGTAEAPAEADESSTDAPAAEEASAEAPAAETSADETSAEETSAEEPAAEDASAEADTADAATSEPDEGEAAPEDA